MEEVPDGAVVFRGVSREGVNVKLQINDMVVNEYHNNNGLTKTTFRLTRDEAEPPKGDAGAYRRNLKDQNATWPVGRSLSRQ